MDEVKRRIDLNHQKQQRQELGKQGGSAATCLQEFAIMLLDRHELMFLQTLSVQNSICIVPYIGEKRKEKINQTNKQATKNIKIRAQKVQPKSQI